MSEIVEHSGSKAWVPDGDYERDRCFKWYEEHVAGKTVSQIARDLGYSRAHMSRCINWAAREVSKTRMDGNESKGFYVDKVTVQMAKLESLLEKMETQEGIYTFNQRMDLVKEIRAHIKLASEIIGVKNPEGSGKSPATINVIMPNLTMADKEPRMRVVNDE